MTACCHKRCAHPVIPGTTRCEKHTDHHRAETQRRRQEWRAAGKCDLCGGLVVPGKARCAKHDSSTGAYKCGACGERGHNRLTCTARAGDPMKRRRPRLTPKRIAEAMARAAEKAPSLEAELRLVFGHIPDIILR